MRVISRSYFENDITVFTLVGVWLVFVEVGATLESFDYWEEPDNEEDDHVGHVLAHELLLCFRVLIDVVYAIHNGHALASAEAEARRNDGIEATEEEDEAQDAHEARDPEVGHFGVEVSAILVDDDVVAHIYKE